MATLVTRLSNTGNLLLNGSFDEMSLAAGSISFNGTNQTISIPSSAGSLFSVGAGDFTIEAWVYLNSGAGVGDIWSASATSGSMAFCTNALGGIRWWVGGDIVNGPSIPTTNAWHHVALVRSSGSVKIYIDGVGGTAATWTNSITGVSSSYVGSYAGNSEWWNGSICNLRFTTSAVYTANFTPPQAMLPVVSGTQLLLNVIDSANFIKDNSPNSLTLTNPNSATFSTANPFNQNSSAVKTNANTVFSKGFNEVTGMITTNGLILDWDPGNLSSYPGTGTKLTDIGGSSDGVLSGSPTLTSSNGFFSYNGTTSYANTAVVNSIGTGNAPHSMEGWLRVDTLPSNRAWIALLAPEGAGAHHWLVRSDGTTQFGIYGGPQVAPSLTVGAWAHIVITSDGTTLTGYKNGTQFASTAVTAFNFSSPSLSVAQARAGENGFTGSIGPFRIYNRAITAAEVQNNYNVEASRFGLTPTAKTGVKREANTGILTAGSFDEITGAPIIDSSVLLWLDAGQTASYPGTGTTWTDLSTNGNNAALANTTYSAANGGAINFQPSSNSVGTLTASKFNVTYTGKTLFFVVKIDPSFGIAGSYHGLIGTVDLLQRNHNLYIYGNGSGYQMHYSWSDGATNYGNYSFGLSITPGQWFMVAVTQDATSHSYYFNGALVNTQSGGFKPYNTSSANEYIGRADNVFWGDIAVGMMYSRTLSADEINQNYNALRRRFGI